MNNTSIAKHVANLVAYAKLNLDLDKYDAVYAHNRLLAELKLTEPEIADEILPDFQTGIVDPIVEYAVENGLADARAKLLFETKILGLVTPSPSYIISKFNAIKETEGVEAATSYLNKISVNNNYIRLPDIKKNIKWTASIPTGDLTITINLSKPEKTPEQIELEKSMPQANYPRCMLCLENLGFEGNFRHPARETIRILPMQLAGENWFMQYSPYVYFDNHCIGVSETHQPMAITPKTFKRLLDFVSLFPHYFMGSNSDLPIVGGSILAHEHYQGGAKVLPMFTRPNRKEFKIASHSDVSVSILDWYNSVIKLSGTNRDAIEDVAANVLASWRTYTDESVGIYANTYALHNTITPIATMENGNYCLYLILRNNRTDDEHPYGIYHPTEDMHNIKKEGIGLIEAMGTFILPGRLSKEIDDMVNVLKGNVSVQDIADSSALAKHKDMIISIQNEIGLNVSEELAREAIVNYINKTCVKILECTGVFKNTEKGQNAFEKFLNSLNIEA